MPYRGRRSVECARLRGRHAALAQHEAAHRPPQIGAVVLRSRSLADVRSGASRARRACDPAVRGLSSPPCVYWIASVSAASFHFSVTSVQAAAGFHASTLRMPSRATRHTVISLSQPVVAEVRDRQMLPVGCQHRLAREHRVLVGRTLQHGVADALAFGDEEHHRVHRAPVVPQRRRTARCRTCTRRRTRACPTETASPSAGRRRA